MRSGAGHDRRGPKIVEGATLRSVFRPACPHRRAAVRQRRQWPEIEITVLRTVVVGTGRRQQAEMLAEMGEAERVVARMAAGHDLQRRAAGVAKFAEQLLETRGGQLV